MTRKAMILLAMGGSGALLLGALGFQYLGDMPPCKMCIWQRWPHVGALLAGALALGLGGRLLPLLGGAGAATSGGIAIYHTGVERGWWEGPTSCTGSASIGGVSAEDLLSQIMAAPVVRCDEVPWEMLGLSMASWNALVSLGLALIWLRAARLAN